MLYHHSSIMKFITTQKGEPALIFNGSHFTLNRKMDTGVIYWRCVKRTCPARITTQDEELLQQTAGHNHPVDAVDCEVQAIRSQMRKRAREEITPIPAIYNEQLISLNTHPERNSIAPKLPNFTSLKSSLYRNRRSRLYTFSA